MTAIPTADEINAMTDRQHRNYEARLRREAKRQGLRLEKSRSRDPDASEWGTYRLVDDSLGIVISYALPNGFGLSLDDVHRSLNEEKPIYPTTQYPR